MNLLRGITPLALAGLVALQISCGDSSGPGASASSIDANSSTTLSAAPGAPVGEPPSVIVRDGSGNTVGGVHVTFTVTSGGGSLTGANAVSSSSGVATVGSWTLGQTPGTNTVSATTSGLPAITFTAEGADPCESTAAHTLGSTTNGQLTTSDCRISDGSLVDFYSVTIPTAGTYLFTQTASFNSYLWLLTPEAIQIGINDDFGGPNTSTIKALLPAGSFLLAANSLNPNVTGTYTLNSSSSSAEVTACEDAFVVPGITTSQTLQTSDCVVTGVGVYSDEYLIFLQAGRSMTATMSSSVVDSYLEVFVLANNTVTLLASNDNIDGTTQNARIALTAPSTAFYMIKARAPTAGVTGAYTLTVQ
jgi:hypothetical protein